MSREILPAKLNANLAVSAESPIVVEKSKEKKKGVGALLLFLMTAGLGAVAVGSITLLAPLTFYDHVGSPRSIDDDGGGDGDRGDDAVIPTVLAPSASATDGRGKVIEDKGLTKSADVTITDYSDSRFSTELRCSIDSLPTYCSGSPVTISGLPPGEHVFTIVEPFSDEITVRSFGWNIS
jgi:hypothetical protein